MELSPSSAGAADALSWPDLYSGVDSDSPLPPDELDSGVPLSSAVAGGMLDRILLESVCQQQSWVRVYDVTVPSQTTFPPPFKKSLISKVCCYGSDFKP